MSITAAAVAKKVAVAVASNKNLLKKVIGIVLVLIIAIIAPIAIMLSVSEQAANIDFNDIQIQNKIIENLSDEEKAKLKALEDTLNTIEDEMIKAGFGSSARTAQVIYVCCLHGKETGEQFYEKLVGCFSSDQTEEELVIKVNDTFGTDISLDDFNNIMRFVKNTYIDTSNFTDINNKNNLDLVEWAKNAYKSKWGYVYGTYGAVLDETLFVSKINQYPNEVGANEQFIHDNWLGGRSADCVGLIKGYGWYDVNSSSIIIGSNNINDVSANSMFEAATVKGTIVTLPETIGLALWMNDHIGIYIGNGEVIDAYNTETGIRKSKLSETTWTHWFEIPNIIYN